MEQEASDAAHWRCSITATVGGGDANERDPVGPSVCKPAAVAAQTPIDAASSEQQSGDDVAVEAAPQRVGE